MLMQSVLMLYHILLSHIGVSYNFDSYSTSFQSLCLVSFPYHIISFNIMSVLPASFQTQPVPNPLSYYLHQSPVLVHKAETLGNHGVELIAPFFLFMPRPLRMACGALQIIFQVRKGGREGQTDRQTDGQKERGREGGREEGREGWSD